VTIFPWGSDERLSVLIYSIAINNYRLLTIAYCIKKMIPQSNLRFAFHGGLAIFLAVLFEAQPLSAQTPDPTQAPSVIPPMIQRVIQNPGGEQSAIRQQIGLLETKVHGNHNLKNGKKAFFTVFAVEAGKQGLNSFVAGGAEVYGPELNAKGVTLPSSSPPTYLDASELFILDNFIRKFSADAKNVSQAAEWITTPGGFRLAFIRGRHNRVEPYIQVGISVNSTGQNSGNKYVIDLSKLDCVLEQAAQWIKDQDAKRAAAAHNPAVLSD